MTGYHIGEPIGRLVAKTVINNDLTCCFCTFPKELLRGNWLTIWTVWWHLYPARDILARDFLHRRMVSSGPIFGSRFYHYGGHYCLPPVIVGNANLRHFGDDEMS